MFAYRAKSHSSTGVNQGHRHRGRVSRLVRPKGDRPEDDLRARRRDAPCAHPTGGFDIWVVNVSSARLPTRAVHDQRQVRVTHDARTAAHGCSRIALDAYCTRAAPDAMSAHLAAHMRSPWPHPRLSPHAAHPQTQQRAPHDHVAQRARTALGIRLTRACTRSAGLLLCGESGLHQRAKSGSRCAHGSRRIRPAEPLTAGQPAITLTGINDTRSTSLQSRAAARRLPMAVRRGDG